LKAQPYLEGLDSSVLAVLASYTEERFFPAGTTIRDHHGPIDRILFLASGAVDLVRSDDSRSSGLQIEAPGSIGLAHYFARSMRTPSVRAVEDTLCLEISTIELERILEDHFSLLFQMARTSCQYAVLALKALGDQRPAELGFRVADRHETPIHLDLVQRLARARRAPFLHGVNLTVLGELFRTDSPRVLAEGEKLWEKGDAVESMAFVLDGSFRTDGSFGECRAPSGATLGAWELFASAERFEGWIAERPSRVLTIHKDLFTDLLEDHFEFAQIVLCRVSQKILEGPDFR
jgi:CRP-like cAMP-binding protein